ncbi:2-hydroxyacid dehydrogenase [Fontivita pretiosa]|uniref:2-hydroxyacid dehydrogenase n=1 Tax=Fontivita pretiosa TaxID=2989684 RepID=UPI003D1806D9
MADTAACPDVFAPLAEVGAEVVTLAADQQVLLERIGEFDAYFASLQVRADAQVLARAPRLRVIATASTGTDHIDLAAARQRNIAVLSLKDDTAFLNQLTATAELAWALLLATVRRLPAAVAAARQGIWGRDRFRGHQLSGKTLGVLGYGRLGRIVAEYGKAFRMRVLACNDTEVSPAPGVQMVSFDTLLRESDVLSIHIHLTDRNRKLINRNAIQRMKPGCVLINTSRGGIIDEPALLEALQTGHLAGAGLDVIDGEWEPDLANHPLLRYAREHENLVITPHIGGVTYESQRMAFAHTVEKLRNFLLSNLGTAR